MEEPKQQQQQQKKEKKENPKKEGGKKEGGKKEGGKKGGDASKKKASDFTFPEHVSKRLQFYDQLKAQQDAANAQLEQKEITLKLPDGKEVKAISNRSTPFEIARNISKNLAEASVIARVNGQLFDLQRPLPLESDGASIEFFTFESEEGKKVFWHSSAHILGQAMEKRYQVCQLTVGPALADSFYYDAATGQELVKEEHYEELKDIISDIVKQKQNFERLVVSRNDALKLFEYNKYKQEIISKIPEEEKVTVYRCGPFVDLCRGPHLPDTSKAKYFHLTKNSSAYWMGKAENDSLQRLYGISFPDKKSYDAWLAFQKEAAERDHRVIGKKQELFFFHTYSPGSCFFLPHGARIYNRRIEFIRAEYRKRGFQEVVTPNIYDKSLWETSGHWQKYRDNMFTFQAEGVDFGLKPMNCPGHCLLFGHRTRSHRELPMRVADFGVLHRNELSGALTGLTRVRRFQQDDAHIFCTEDQIQSEIKSCLEFMAYVYGVFGFEFKLELSTRPENFLGEIEVWNRAEKQLEEELVAFGRPWKLNPGDGAFYGPKIDIHIFDALRRSHQCATIQLDFQLPIRFGLEYQEGEGSSVKKPVIIHRAILGSVERMIANLIELYAGKWPFWLSPRQIIVVPVAETFFDYARQVQKRLEEENFFVDVDLSSKQFQKKISMARMSNVYYNFILVVGKEEVEAGGVNVRTRENEVVGLKTLDAVVEEFKTLRAQFK